MRVLFCSYSEKPLFRAMVPLAWALRTAGHEVRVASQPELTEAIVGAGLTAVPVGRDHGLWRLLDLEGGAGDGDGGEDHGRRGLHPPFDVAEHPEPEIGWEHLRAGYDDVVGVYRMLNDCMLTDLVSFARSWRPDLVVWEPHTYAGAVAARACGARHARLLWSRDYFGRTREHLRRMVATDPARHDHDALARWLRARCERVGAQYTEDLTVGEFTIDQFPESLGLTTGLQRVPMRYVDYNGPAAVPDWLRRPPSRPRVCLTLGLTAFERYGGYALGAGGVLRALAGLDVEVVATLPDAVREQVGPLPDTVRTEPFVPLHALVPTCSVVIHHAGFGTLCTTALHGVPQLCLPEHFDEPRLAECLADRGAGLTVPVEEADPATVAECVTALLEDPSFAAGAAGLAAEMAAMPAPNSVVEQLAARDLVGV